MLFRCRRSEQRAQLCPRARGLSDVVEHRDPFAECDPQRVEGPLAADQPVAERLIRRRLCERAEQAIEYDQDAAVILVEAGLVRRVMHAMVRRRVEHEFERTQPRCKLGMDEELIGQVDAEHRDDGKRMKSDPDQRQEEQEVAGDVAGPAEPDGRRQVEFGRRMMDPMCRPHPADPVRGTVLPVIEELAAQKQAEHGRRAGRGEFEQPVLIDERERYRDDAGLDEADEVLHDRDAKRRGTLPPIMRFAMHEAAEPIFQRHEAERRHQDQAAEVGAGE